MENPRAQRVQARGDRQCHRKQTACGFSQERPRARVKRRGKSPPPAHQCAGHEKPSAVQDKTGGRVSARSAKVDSLRVLVALAARASARAIGHSLSGEWREMIGTRCASGGDRIRLIASKKRGVSGKPGAPSLFRGDRPRHRRAQGVLRKVPNQQTVCHTDPPSFPKTPSCRHRRHRIACSRACRSRKSSGSPPA